MENYNAAVTEAKKRRIPNLTKIVAVCLSCLLLCALTVGGTLLVSESITLKKTNGQLQLTTQSHSISTIANVEGGQMTSSQIYEKYVNSVVGITTKGMTTNIFGQTTDFAASGSGFVITSDGYIVTNNHVVEDGKQFTVAFVDGTEYEAKVVGTDNENDIALLKIDASGLTPVVIGDSDDLVVGEEICTIGNPLGELTFSLSKGVVSALHRVIDMGDGYALNMFQMDAAVNSGNSGGPVFNSYGEVIGVTTAKYSDTGIEGLGFGLPINDVIAEVNDLKEYGYVRGRPYFGISVSTATTYTDPRFGDTYGVAGARVEAVDQASCAEKAGLKVGDIITKIDETEIKTYTDLVSAKSNYKAGDNAVLTVYRNGQTLTLNITFDEKKS